MAAERLAACGVAGEMGGGWVRAVSYTHLDVYKRQGFVGPYWMGIAKDLTGNYQRGLLTMAPVMLTAAAIMLYLSRQTQTHAPAPAALPIASALDSPNL